MKTTLKQDRDFRDEFFPLETLGKMIEWITENFSPEELFDEEKLHEWAKSNGYVEEE